MNEIKDNGATISVRVHFQDFFRKNKNQLRLEIEANQDLYLVLVE